ncbi:MAG: HD domain-containing protein [Proteobacteria bacterium]|nr:HD domain-containing protein [Pseudomonadota bacterium]
MTTQPEHHILFVDDDKRALDSYRRLLSEKYHIFSALNASEAFKIIEQNSEIKVIISDLKMPGIDGIRFLELTKDLLPDAVRILLTGFADLQNALDAVNRGQIFRLLNKPCSADLLLASIEAGLKQYQLVADSRALHTLNKTQQILNGIVAGLSTLLEARDPYTAGHQRRVAALARTIGTEMGFAEDRLNALEMTGRLHDLGKVYVPADFLNKPGRLSPEEFSIIHKHPEVGASILKNVDFDWPVAEIILQHHERMDGTGYPRGLKGDEILLEARILAVADVVDAMSSRRPYREPLGLDIALGNIESNMHTVFDPEVAKICLSLFREKDYSLQKMADF